MIADVTQWIVGRLEKIRRTDAQGQSVPVKVYPPGPERDQGETEDPHIAVSLTDWAIDRDLYRPSAEVLNPSAETVTVTVPEEMAGSLLAVVISSKQGPYQIVEDVSDSLLLRVGTTNAWSEPIPVTLMPGSREAWEVANGIIYAGTMAGRDAHPTKTPGTEAGTLPEAGTSAIIASEAEDGWLLIQPAEPGMDLEIMDCPNSAYAVLGLTVGVVSHQSQTGPQSYGVARSPIPVRLEYLVQARATEQAQQRGLEFWALHAIRDGHWPVITRADGSAFAPVFEVAKVRLHEEGFKPEYETAIRYEVSQVWLEYPADYQVLGITEYGWSLDT